jgi:hypothetical protein
MKVRFTSVGDEILQPLFFTSQSLHPRVVFLTFSMCAAAARDRRKKFYCFFFTFYDFLSVKSMF